jgi:putative oxidoreductase
MSARGTDTARLLLRAVVGGTMIAHGIRHARALDGTARWFGSIGFRQPELQARTSAAVEISAGAALLTGAATPAAAAAVIGTMAVAGRAVHLKNGYFIVDEDYECVLSLAAAAAATAALGPGPVSVDSLLRADRFSGARAALLAVGIGVGAAAAQLALFWRPPRAAEPEAPAGTRADDSPESTAAAEGSAITRDRAL